MNLSKKIFLALGIGFFLGSLFNYLGVFQDKVFIDFIEKFICGLNELFKLNHFSFSSTKPLFIRINSPGPSLLTSAIAVPLPGHHKNVR